MHHIAIMNPKSLIDKILSGEKKIETRWYKHKINPWNSITTGDSIYFKESGGAVRAKATVKKVLRFSKKESECFEKIQAFNAKEILQKYGDGIYIEDLKVFQEYAEQKNYAILIFLKNPEPVKPFQINKTGFGNSCAWLSVKDVDNIKKN